MAGIVAGLLLSALPAARAQNDTALPGDKLVLELREAFRKGDTRTLGQKLPQLDGHPLQPLAAYWDMKLRLEWASADDVRAFTERFAGSYYEDRLRNDWLLLLGRRGDWASFGAELPRFRMNDDREVQCYGLLLQHQTGGTDVTEAVRERWMAQKAADDEAAERGQLLNLLLGMTGVFGAGQMFYWIGEKTAGGEDRQVGKARELFGLLPKRVETGDWILSATEVLMTLALALFIAQGVRVFLAHGRRRKAGRKAGD